MRRHELDATALFFGLLFLGTAGLALAVQADAADLGDGTLWAIVLVAAGAVGLVSTVAASLRRPTPAAHAVGSVDATAPFDRDAAAPTPFEPFAARATAPAAGSAETIAPTEVLDQPGRVDQPEPPVGEPDQPEQPVDGPDQAGGPFEEADQAPGRPRRPPDGPGRDLA